MKGQNLISDEMFGAKHSELNRLNWCLLTAVPLRALLEADLMGKGGTEWGVGWCGCGSKAPGTGII